MTHSLCLVWLVAASLYHQVEHGTSSISAADLQLAYWWECSSRKSVRELGSERCKSVWSISLIIHTRNAFFSQYARTRKIKLKLNLTIQWYHCFKISDLQHKAPVNSLHFPLKACIHTWYAPPMSAYHHQNLQLAQEGLILVNLVKSS